MQNPFKYSFDNKRYHTFNYYLKNTYHVKVAKVILDADFTCPNRDGTKGYGGCIYCSGRGSGDTSAVFHNNLLEQFLANKKAIDAKWQPKLYIPYFQSFSNTYGPLEKIKNYLEIFKDRDDVAEISLGTRADCLEPDVVAYLDDFTKYKPIWLEIGLQTSNDATAKLINRGHDFACFKDALERLSKTNIKVCVHVINGLPGETREDMLQTIRDLNELPYDAIKFHMLHIIQNTTLAKMYLQKPFKVLSETEYIDILIKQIEMLPPEVIVERVTGDPLKSDLIEPRWILNKKQVLNDIDKTFVKYDTYQGRLYHNKSPY